MATAHLSVNLLDHLKTEVGQATVDEVEEIVLTPYLTLACGLLYMVAADGDLGSVESSHLQSVLGGDEGVLQYALRYVQTVPVEQFFSDAPEVLSAKDKWCILVNVCDALLADGRAEAEELALFKQMTQAFGVGEAQFEPYFKILALKNDKWVLGRYAGVKDERQPMTPHFALAISLLYMLTADGSIGRQEVGQLEAVIGEFAGLQTVALKYVRAVKLKQFLDEACVLLTPDQKLYILVNVCDSMMSDGSVARLEDKVFVSMLTAFGYSEKAFEIYLRVLETKCFKPFDTSKFVNGVAHSRLTGGPKEEGVLFEGVSFTRDDGMKVATDAALPAANQAVWSGPAEESAMGAFITRTMADNIQNVSDSFETQAHVIQVAENATGALNLQTVAGASGAENRQAVASEASDLNRQRVGSGQGDKNLQTLGVEPIGKNRQPLAQASAPLNRQSLDSPMAVSNRVSLETQAQLNNIHEVVEEVHGRLDRFEREHFSFLQIGRAHRWDDSFALLEEDAPLAHRQMIDASLSRLGLRANVSATAENAPLAQTTDMLPPDAPALPYARAGSAVNEAAKPSEAASVVPSQLLVQARSPGVASVWRQAVQVSYLKVMLGCVAVAFASPIDYQTPVRRAVAGPLVVLPPSPEPMLQHFSDQPLGQTGLAVQLD